MAANAMSPISAQAGVTVSAKDTSSPLTAESIGQSVAKYVGSIPVFREIGKQLSDMVLSMKRVGPQTTPPIVLPPPPTIIPLPPMPTPTTSQAVPLGLPQPALPPTTTTGQVPVQPNQSTQQLVAWQRSRQGGADLSAQLLSRSLGGVPILGVILRQASLMQELFKESQSTINIRPLRPGASSDRMASHAAMQLFRKRTSVSPIAASVMRGMKNFGPGAISKRAGKIGGALWNKFSGSGMRAIKSRYRSGSRGEKKAIGTMNRAAAGAAIDLGVLAGSAVAVAGAVVAFGKSISDSNRSLSGYNGAMAASYAISDIKGIFRDMRSANARAGSTGQFLKSWDAFMDKMQPVMDSLTNSVLKASSAILDNLLPPLFTLASAFSNLANGHLFSDSPDTTKARQDATDGPKRFFDKALKNHDLTRARGEYANTLKRIESLKKHQEELRNEIGWNPLKSIQLGFEGQSNRDEITRAEGLAKLMRSQLGLAEGGEFPVSPAAQANTPFSKFGGDDIYKGVRYNGITDMKEAIKEAVKAMRELNETLTADGTQQGLTMAQVGAGMATADTGFYVKDRNFAAQAEVWRAAANR